MNHYSISLPGVFEILRKNVILILFVTLFAAAAVFALCYYVITPQYTATASMYVHSNSNRSEITQFELSASQELVSTYIVIIKSDAVLDKVISTLGLSLTPKELRKNLEAASLDETEAFSISYTNSDAVYAQTVVNKIVDIAPEEIIRIVKAGGVEVIDYAKVPAVPASPNTLMYTIIGAFIGFFITLGICIIVKKLDTKVHEEKDLSRFNIPVVGIIPVN